jgi:hypothetical protein
MPHHGSPAAIRHAIQGLNQPFESMPARIRIDSRHPARHDRHEPSAALAHGRLSFSFNQIDTNSFH